jgi:ferredoxin--NADP+ reductase
MTDLLNATVQRATQVSPELRILRVLPDDGEPRRFQAGQFAVLGLPPTAPRHPLSDREDGLEYPTRLIRRAYSIASASDGESILEFYIALVRSGELTPRLFELQAGDRLWLGPKVAGLFTLDQVPTGADVVMIGTGTGLAPYMSMLRTHLECGNGRRFVVIHGAKHSWDLGYRGELVSLAKACPNLSYLPTITRADEEPVPWGGRVGRVQDAWSELRQGAAGYRPTPESAHVFLCGNPAMIESMERLLADDGFLPADRAGNGQVHRERYW